MLGFVSNLFRGAAVGLANIIPGVSGGTMLLLLGVYERVISGLKNLGPQTIKNVLRGKIVEEWKRLDASLIAALVVGAAGAAFAASKLLLYLLNHRAEPTYGLFFGLVLASVVVPYKMIKKRGLAALLACLIGIAGVIGLTEAMSGERRLANERKKAEVAMIKAKAKAAGERAKLGDVSLGGKQFMLFFLAGVVAVVAMILPGISGSFMLLLMGVYFEVLAALSALNLPLLGSLGLGCIVGLLIATRALSYLLKNFHDATMAFLMGLVVGSLWAIWPYKSFEMVAFPTGPKRVDLANIIPASWGSEQLLTIGTVALGIAIVAGFLLIEAKLKKADGAAA
ncbi:MAG: DUF368 domain-containing protein [Deltaproteobacteria bacterium]|nr:DUF368 domain-containing protein [Deltaproteobacteria bacterium]